MGTIIKTSNIDQVDVDMGKEAIEIGKKAGALIAEDQAEERKRPPKSLAEQFLREIDDELEKEFAREDLVEQWHRHYTASQAQPTNS